MKRHLLYQICREKRSNAWMILELTIVSLVLWFIFTMLCSLMNVHMRDDGYDFNDVYVSEVRFVGNDSQFFRPYADSIHSLLTDYQLLIANLRANEHVEIVGTCTNAIPYNYNYYGSKFYLNDSTFIYGNQRLVSPEYIKLMRLEGRNGESPDQLATIIENGKLLIAPPDIDYSEHPLDLNAYVGKDLSTSDDMSNPQRLGAIAAGLRRADYESLTAYVFYLPLSNNIGEYVAFRIRHGHDKEFLESLTPDIKKVGNAYISEPVSIDYLREQAHVDYNLTIRNFIVCAVFLLLVIFLGFLGTFWFRTQQRVGEIAIRLVNGATPADIFRRFIGEGIIMLCIATILATPLEIAAINGLVSFVNDMNFGGIEVYESMCVTFVLLALLIVAGIWVPARKAMKINPAFALKDQ